MRLVITGALGHIGSAVLHSLRPGAYERVLLVDNLSTSRYCSLFNLPPGVPFRFVEADVRTANLTSLFEGADCVVHLAAATDAVRSGDHPEETDGINRLGTARVAEACRLTGARLLFVSTTSVYGAQASVVDEECAVDDLRPQSCYATSKLQAEHLLVPLGDAGLRYAVTRFGTVFGVSIGMRFHTAVNKFCWQASMGEPITVWRSALDQMRPYLAIHDAVRAIDFILRRDLFDGRVYNVVTVNTTVGDIVEIIRRDVPSLQVEYVDSPIMNQLSYTVRAERFANAGFAYVGDLARAVRETLRLLRLSQVPDRVRRPPLRLPVLRYTSEVRRRAHAGGGS